MLFEYRKPRSRSQSLSHWSPFHSHDVTMNLCMPASRENRDIATEMKEKQPGRYIRSITFQIREQVLFSEPKAMRP